MTSLRDNPLPRGIYGITAEKFSKGRSNIEVAQAMIDGGINIIQYREKRHRKSARAMLDECLRIRELTRRQDVRFIVNDFVDLALLCDADGVHVGQDDLPVPEVRRLVGEDIIIGLSTHSPEQAREAIAVGADYIGVGPIFSTQTKTDVCDPVGLDYLDFAVAHLSIPFVAIGGIKSDTIDRVRRRGAETICLVTEIVEARDIAAKARSLGNAMTSTASGN